MRNEISGPLRELADIQRGVIARGQALAGGLSTDLIPSRVRSGRWQRLSTGVYAIFSGPVSREAALWAAVLRAGPGAALSYQTAAELDGLTDEPSPPIHITIPAIRRVTAGPGVVLHTRIDLERATHPARLPPRTRVEETVLDLAQSSANSDAAVGWITRALGRRLTTQDLLRDAVVRRARLRWRADIAAAVAPDLAGLHSGMEFRYFRDVEAAHGLPKGQRQAKVCRDGLVEYRDVLYQQFALAVELDGRIAHPGDTRWLDIRRDNAAAATGIATLRYGWRDVTSGKCRVAAEVAVALRLRGWQGAPRPCSPRCTARYAD